MFERYTERARRCIYFARQSAAKYGSQTIETEDLLLGILHEDPDVIGRFLPSKTAQDIRAEIEGRLTERTAEPPRLLRLLLRLRPVSASIEIPLSLYCKRILVYAAGKQKVCFIATSTVTTFLWEWSRRRTASLVRG